MLSIIEAVIVLVATALLTLQGIQHDVEMRRQDVLSVEGKNQAVITAALSKWVTDKYASLVGQMVGSKATAIAPPTLADLRAGGYLKANYATGPIWGGNYMIQMSVGPDNCSTGSGSCQVSYVFYSSQPVTRLGKPDVAGAGIVAQAAGNDFGISTTQNPATIKGLNGRWYAVNPVPGAPAAIVMATNGPSSDGNSVFIRRDGALKWTGSQDVNGVDLHNVGNIDAQGTIAAPMIATSNAAVSNAIRTPGTLAIQNAAGTGPAPISSGDSTVNGNATITGTATMGSIAVPRAACAGTGIASAADGSGMLFSCQRDPISGLRQWLPVGGTWQQYARYLVSHGAWVPAPSCNAGGTPEVLLAPQSVYIDPTAAVSFNADGVGPWTISITDGSGNPISINAVATTYCAY
ncbi:hypothetical protein QZM46_26685 [Burkholderia vietnamiensis]|jgi:hypothetical protein|uniref:Shufflon system plasmid conjugative transfer pilus tip adhesin PilV n=3 Tax=Burkholderia vietnamiensis TaxID=60552 RepID=A4JUJ9_BURVG|nr:MULTISPECIES: hypothetical protein [Burkholderia]ABO59952.1 hypothetical protein Bcep1808_7069 [Burkholderia vietnamiensis G4]KVR84954.1 hypothetical protein WK24_24350 [Burkholderia vietnamiensis]MBH9647836.1 hypothetical protein [Burkholderia vietnamiensis]MBR8008776.1 hypothetical protein [Burkholderia vietnamiensis]MBR8217489.1 hypothetical protein [Burkholderia vietnamiensis]